MAVLGEIRIFAGTFVPSGWAKCDGSVLAGADNPDLAEYLGTTYGGVEQGDEMTYGLPNLGANVPLHRSSIYPLGHTSSGPLGVALPAPLQYIIATTTPPYDTPFVGEVRTFAFGTVPRGWALCDGSILSAAISANQPLYSIVGNQFGGSSEQGTFGVPDLRGNTASPVTSSDPLGYVVMNYCIALDGLYPEKP